jgi:hypothetical protein
MVQILPPKTDAGTILGTALGGGLSSGIQQGSNVAFQRGLLENALKDVQNIPPELKALLVGTAGADDQGRVLQAALPFIQNRMQAQQAQGVPSPTQPSLGGPTTPHATEFKKAETLPIQLPQPAVGLGEGFANIGLGVGEMPKTYSEDQYKQVNQQYLNANVDPARALQQMQLQDQIARERFQDIERAAGRQAEFTNHLQKANPTWSPGDLAVGERISLLPENRNIKNDALREDRVRKRVELYQGAKDNLKKNSERKSYDASEHNRQVKNLSSYAQTMVNAGQRDEAEQMLAENMWGPTEIQSILNPLDEKIVQGFKGLPKPKGILEQVKSLPDTPAYEAQTQQAYKNRVGDLNKYKNFIEKSFKTGTYDPVNAVKPGTSLLEMRDEVMQNGVTFQEFEDMINSLKREGKIQLDQYQENEHPLLAEHPARSFGLGEILWRINPFYIPRK